MPDTPMLPRLRGFALAGAALVAGSAIAQQPVPPPPRLAELDPAAAQTAPRRVASAASAASASAEGRPHLKVIEDDNVRIEEARVRGQVQRITVQNKVAGARDYEIIVTPGGKDTSQDRGAMGQRAWSLFAF